VIYWCCQTQYKYLPQYDEVFPRIAVEVPDAVFVFVGHRSRAITDVLVQRLKATFEKYGLDARKHILFLGRLLPPEFTAVTALADIFLDSIEWSGMNTVMEAMTYDLPIVTWPGSFMRGRHAEAILRRMNVTETIAESLDDYVKIAIKLGVNTSWRNEITQKIENSKAAIYTDMAPITALEDFLFAAIKSKSVVQ